jgi:hypothetical protein
LNTPIISHVYIISNKCLLQYVYQLNLERYDLLFITSGEILLANTTNELVLQGDVLNSILQLQKHVSFFYLYPDIMLVVGMPQGMLQFR